MEKIIQKQQTLLQALKTLEAVINTSTTLFFADDIKQESIIKRFEYCSVLFWNFLKSYIFAIYGIDLPASSKTIIKYGIKCKIFINQESSLASTMRKDYCFILHCYEDAITNNVSAAIAHYYLLMF